MTNKALTQYKPALHYLEYNQTQQDNRSTFRNKTSEGKSNESTELFSRLRTRNQGEHQKGTHHLTLLDS